MTTRRPFSKVCAFAAAGTMAVLGCGQARAQEVREVAGYLVGPVDGGCMISQEYHFDGRSPVRMVVAFDGDRPAIVITSLDWSARDGEDYELEVALDGGSFGGKAVGYVDGVYKGFMARFPADFLTDFAASRSMMVSRGDQVVTHVNLEGSAAAVAELRRCATRVARADAEEARARARWDYIEKDPFSGASDGPAVANLVTDPEWIQRPSADFPERAGSRGLHSGSAQLECGVNRDGVPTSCRVITESPVGMGFGGAALRSMGGARLAPSTVDRAGPSGRVHFTVHFRAVDEAPPS